MARQTKKHVLIHCKVKKILSNPRCPWRVWFSIERAGNLTRAFKSFADEERAWHFAMEKDLEIANHGTRFADLPIEARRAYDWFRDESAALEAEGVDVPRFEQLVTSALASIRAEHEKRLLKQVSVAEVVEEFLSYKKTRVSKRHNTDLTVRLKRFAGEFGTEPLASITAAQVDEWLSSLRSLRSSNEPLQAQTRNHFRAALHSLFAYAAAPARAYCQMNPVAHLDKEKVTKNEPEAYLPGDVEKIMQTALEKSPELVPVLALGFFCGLRVSEAMTIDLEVLLSTEAEFKVVSCKTGTRMSPLTPAARAWLTTQPRRTGRAWLENELTYFRLAKALIEAAGVKPITNGARHSFISYRTAMTRDVAKVADECGNSVEMIKNHYRQIVTLEMAKKYFSISPAQPAENVTPISKFTA